jgi:hydrogenase nickel incorporation protein HypA/HybF
MHEMSLCEGIRKIVEEQALSQAFRRVKRIWLEIGALAGVEKEALSFGFDVVMKNSPAEGSALEIIEIPGEAWCFQCMKTVPVRQRFDACPQCNAYTLQVTAGDEMRVKEMEVE